MQVYDCFHTWHAAVTNFQSVLVEYFLEFMFVVEMFVRNFFPTSVATFLQKGGLNQIIFLLRDLRFSLFCSGGM